MKKLLALPLLLMFLGAGCSSSTAVQTTASMPTPPVAPEPGAAPSAQPTAANNPPSSAPLPGSGPRALLTLSGGATVKGTGSATCDFSNTVLKQGVAFRTDIGGWSLQLVNDTYRTPGLQGKELGGNWLLTGPSHAYISKGDTQVTFGPDMKWATIHGSFNTILNQGTPIVADGRIDCE